MSYAAGFLTSFERAATSWTVSWKGQARGSPGEQPTKYELVINLGTAGASTTIPQSLLLRADRVIDMNRRDLVAAAVLAVLAKPIASMSWAGVPRISSSARRPRRASQAR